MQACDRFPPPPKPRPLGLCRRIDTQIGKITDLDHAIREARHDLQLPPIASMWLCRVERYMSVRFSIFAMEGCWT